MDESQRGFELQGVGLRVRDAELLRDVDLVLPGAAWTVILGPSGSGKTTLLRLLNRLSDPSRGRILWAGKPLVDYDVRGLRREVALLVQQPRLAQGTAQASLELPLRLGAIDERALRERLQGACEIAQLPQSLLPRDVNELSGGERQRLALARALLLAPRALLLDEPTAALDRDTSRRLIAALEALRAREGTTLIAVTHRVDELAELARQCVVMAAGTVVEQGPPERVLHAPESEAARALLR